MFFNIPITNPIPVPTNYEFLLENALGRQRTGSLPCCSYSRPLVIGFKAVQLRRTANYLCVVSTRILHQVNHAGI